MSRRAIGLLVALVGLVGGCVGARPPTATPSPSPTQTPTATPTATPPPTTAAPTLSATPTTAAGDPCANSTPDDPADPPEAALAGADGIAVAGRLGSYGYCDISVDALPPRADSLPTVNLGTEVALTTSGAEGFIAYRAGYWPAAEWQGEEIRFAADELDAPTEEATFEAPPRGDWMLSVGLTFASGGDAVYYWHVNMP